MILSDKDIKKFLELKRITIEPLFPNSIQPASVDLHLGSDFLIFKTSRNICIDLKEPLDHM
ncbi:MAG: dCTP deaminase, partial [Patescibacteria group bacterium]